MQLPGSECFYGFAAPWALRISLSIWDDSAGGRWFSGAHRWDRDHPCPALLTIRRDPLFGHCTGRPRVGQPHRPNFGPAAGPGRLGRNLSGHLPKPTGKPADVPGALSIGALLAFNPLLIPAAVQDGLEHRWVGLALKSVLTRLRSTRGFEPVPNSVEPVPPDAGGHPSLADLLDGGRGSLGQLAPSPGRFRCAHDGLQPANSLQRPSYRRCASSRSSQFVAGARLDSGPGILAARWMTVA